MSTQTSRVTLPGEMLPAYNEILTPEALSFLKELHGNFNERRIELLQSVRRNKRGLMQGSFRSFRRNEAHT